MTTKSAWQPIDSIPKDGSDVFLSDKSKNTVTWGYWDGESECVMYSWFGSSKHSKDDINMFVYWYPMPK